MSIESFFAKEISGETVKPDIFKNTNVDQSFDIYKPFNWSHAETNHPNDMMIEYAFPNTNGQWDGEKGNSTWMPDGDYVPKKPSGNEKTWEEILAPYEEDGVEFKDGEPDFTPFSEASVEIKDFGLERDDNFAQADEALAEEWSKEQKDGKNWTPEDIEKYRKENKLSWHERSDQKTMDLVPQEIHGNIPHSGGISEAKKSKGVDNA
jgi:hypothetical protein